MKILRAIGGVALTLFMCLSAGMAYGVDVNIEYEFPTRVSLSAEKVNRLHFKKHRVSKIVGDSTKYQAVISKNKQDVFLQLKVRAEEIIHLSIVDIKGRVMDFEIAANDNPYPLILNIDSMDIKRRKDQRRDAEYDKLLMAMQSGVHDKYYVVEGAASFKCPVAGKGAKCSIIADYRFGNLRGIGLKIKNKGGDIVSLNPESIARAMNHKIKRSSPDRLYIAASEEGVIYFVMEGGQDV